MQSRIVLAFDLIEIADGEVSMFIEILDMGADFFKREEDVVAVYIVIHVLGNVADGDGFSGDFDGVNDTIEFALVAGANAYDAFIDVLNRLLMSTERAADALQAGDFLERFEVMTESGVAGDAFG